MKKQHRCFRLGGRTLAELHEKIELLLSDFPDCDIVTFSTHFDGSKHCGIAILSLYEDNRPHGAKSQEKESDDRDFQSKFTQRVSNIAKDIEDKFANRTKPPYDRRPKRDSFSPDEAQDDDLNRKPHTYEYKKEEREEDLDDYASYRRRK